MEKLKSYIKMIPGALLVLVFIFFGLKGCVMTLWTYPKQPEAYSIEGHDGREIIMLFMPTKETVFWYSDPSSDVAEMALMRMRGTYGTHYFGPLWTTDGLFGYHWLPDGVEAVQMETTVLNKYREGYGDSSFPDKGDRRKIVMYFAQDSLRWEGMWLNRIGMTEDQAYRLHSRIALEE